MSSDDEREILALMCRVHELEADKMALQSERLVRQHELRRRDLVILRYDRQRQLCEEIITRQRQLIEGRYTHFGNEKSLCVYAIPLEPEKNVQVIRFIDFRREIEASRRFAGALPALPAGNPRCYLR